MIRKAKIVATIGPASMDKHSIRSLIQAGMNVARINFSHGTREGKTKVVESIRYFSKRLGKPVMLLADLQGPKIRTGLLENASVELIAGNRLTLTTEEFTGTTEKVSVDFKDLLFYVQPGSRILLADGQMELLVKEVGQKDIETEIILGGPLGEHKGVNLPGAKLDIPGFTEKDESDLKFALELGVDAVAISFVRTAQDVGRVRNALSDTGNQYVHTPIIAKLERPEALDNLEAIIRAADGVMVARGDLGVEMSPQAVPIAQKQIIEAANKHSKVVITATQMLESMLENPRPTRAEASDVANAIFDGTDAVMLSGETAVGKYPIQAVQMMDAIVKKAEEHLQRWGHWSGNTKTDFPTDAHYLCNAAAELAFDRTVAGVAIFTKSGRTSLLMSKTRPSVPILGFTTDEQTYRRMSLFWGVLPFLVPNSDNMTGLLAHVESGLLSTAAVRPGQQVVLICGYPVDEMRPSNLVMLHTVGQRS